MGLWFVLVACWIDWEDLDGDAAGFTCSGGGAPVYWYRDADGDGYGNDLDALSSCDPPLGFAPAGGDCDETDPGVNPATAETCNGLDDDCDYQVDEGGDTWCNDVDLDGHGDPDDVIHSCDRPAGYAASCDDCDDADGQAYPGAAELDDDGIDNDCDTLVDE